MTAATAEPGRGDSLLKHTAFRVKSTLPSVGSLLPPVGSGEYEAPREHPSGPRRANRGVATPVASRPSMYGEATVLSRSASVMCVVATRCPLSLGGRHLACRVKAPLFGRAEHEAPRQKIPESPQDEHTNSRSLSRCLEPSFPCQPRQRFLGYVALILWVLAILYISLVRGDTPRAK